MSTKVYVCNVWLATLCLKTFRHNSTQHTKKYNGEDMRDIILTRARKEGIKIEADALDYLVEIGEKPR